MSWWPVRDELARQNALLSEIASTDHLTGVSNRRAFGEALRRRQSFAGRYETAPVAGDGRR